MSLPRIATREEWVAASEALLAEEKELTRRRDALNARRRELPMVEVTEDYTFDGPDGPARLLDMFEGRRQLIVYHFMFDPSWDDGCPSCTAGTDELSPGFFEHLHVRDTSYALVSRAPQAKLRRWKELRHAIERGQVAQPCGHAADREGFAQRESLAPAFEQNGEDRRVETGQPAGIGNDGGFRLRAQPLGEHSATGYRLVVREFRR